MLPAAQESSAENCSSCDGVWVLLKVHSQTAFKERLMRKPIVNTGEDFDEKSIAAQKLSCLHRWITGEGKRRKRRR